VFAIIVLPRGSSRNHPVPVEMRQPRSLVLPAQILRDVEAPDEGGDPAPWAAFPASFDRCPDRRLGGVPAAILIRRGRHSRGRQIRIDATTGRRSEARR
jgi:hypothetical protein